MFSLNDNDYSDVTFEQFLTSYLFHGLSMRDHARRVIILVAIKANVSVENSI